MSLQFASPPEAKQADTDSDNPPSFSDGHNEYRGPYNGQEETFALFDPFALYTVRKETNKKLQTLSTSVVTSTCTPTVPNIPATPDHTLNQPQRLPSPDFKPSPRPRLLTPAQLATLIDDMAFFNPAPPSKDKLSRPQNDIDDFLSSDLELSFASTMSLNSPSASRAPSPIAMDISPAPPKNAQEKRSTTSSRLFGRDLLNGDSSSDTKSKNRGRQRAALPTQWLKPEPSLTALETLTVPSTNDAMDIDMNSLSSPDKPNLPSPSPAPLVTNTNYSNLFFAASSPEPNPAPAPKKRRSISPEPNQSFSSSDPPSSPSHSKFTRAATIATGAPLFKKKPMLEYSAPSSKRGSSRRPALSTIVNPSNGSGNLESAYPILSGSGADNSPAMAPLPPPRRAFSAMVPALHVEPSSDDFSDVPTSSPAAAYAKRHQARILRRCDGSEDLRPANGAGALGKRDREQFQNSFAKACSPKSLAAFGVKEVDQKILPCHRVSEDGLVRITSDTLKDLLSGTYSSQISGYTIVDCRFEYEYEGGHIPGAINLNTTAAVEEHFLGTDKPVPCQSGDPTAKNILVFHCEFSIKRAPTFAKHVRSKDRSLNGRVYPKVCYPEMYILEGGYSQFFKEYPTFCEPQGYIQMDDPAYTQARDTDLGNFRRGKWLRTQSYTYGQSSTGILSFPSSSTATGPSTATTKENRKTAPSGGPGGNGSMFAAANAARGRRTTGMKGLSTLDEDVSSSSHEDSESNDLHDSPCPPPSKGGNRPISLGTNKSNRGGPDRSMSFGPLGSRR